MISHVIAPISTLLVQIPSDERSPFQLSLIQAGWHLPLPQRIAAARSFICSDHVRAEQEHRLDGVLLVQGPQVLQEEAHCGEEPLDADLRHRERSERLVRDPHRSRVE